MFRRSKSQFHVRFAFCSLVGLLALAAPLSGAEVFNKPDLKGAKYEGPDEVPVVLPYLYIEPIAGLTTVRHRAPGQTAIPLGTELKLFVGAPERAQVSFTGATITSRNAQGVFATCSLSQVGRTTIDVMVRLPDGTSRAYSCLLDAVPITVEQIAVTAITVSVEPFDLDETATNTDTMVAYFGESIATLQPTSTGYRTSTNREIRMVPELNHPEFLPLMEWRIDGAARALGADERKETFTTPGSHTYSVGPPDRSAETVIETYSVSITSHESDVDIVGEGEPITFVAVTDPPGYEDDIMWLSSTLFGTASPVVGYGRSFAVEFNGTFGPHPDGGAWQWLGAKADNAVFNQDQKPNGACCDIDGNCQQLTWNECCAAEGFYRGDGSSCNGGDVCPVQRGDWLDCVGCSCCGAIVVGCGISCVGATLGWPICFTGCLEIAGGPAVGALCVGLCTRCFE